MDERSDDDRQHRSSSRPRFEELDRDRHWRPDGRECVRQRQDGIERQDNGIHIVERRAVIVGVVVVGGAGMLDVHVMRSTVAVHHQFMMVLLGGFMDVRRRRQREDGEANCQHERRWTRETHQPGCYVSGRTGATEVFLKRA